MKIAIHGLGRMGMQIAKKIAESGEHIVIAHNRSQEPMDEAVKSGAIKATTKQEVIEKFDNDTPIIWIMLPSEITDGEAIEWSKLLPSGSIIINGGNSDYRNTHALNQKIKASGIHFVDIGVSGGVWGYDRGFPLMCGTDEPETYNTIKPILDILASPGGMHALMGSSGAGHYVKMVHNAIEYGMMQSIAEGYHLVHDSPFGKNGLDIKSAANVWQSHSVIDSWLNELARDIVNENPNLDGVEGYVAENGEARWALETGKSQQIDMPAIQAALNVRKQSQLGKTSYATKMLAALRNKFGGHNMNGEGRA